MNMISYAVHRFFCFMMTYQQTVEYLYSRTPVFEHVGASAYKEGLSNTLALDAHLGHPHRQYRTIHVAGTNGKGSCSHTLAAMLQAQGYRVGLYTSPHLVDFRERIRVNGQMISRQRVVDFVHDERSFFEPLHPSFFELTTALAFLYFAEQHVDVAVIEVGLGGRLDCTNIITPLLSVITNISFDHTQFLGNTLALIAAEKAGIVKPGVPVLIGENRPETRSVFTVHAQEAGASIVFADDEPEVMSSTADLQHGGRIYQTRHFGVLKGELGGDYQQQNTNTVLKAVSLLRRQGLQLSDENVRRGLASVTDMTGLAGRWQRIHEHPAAICDTGHNEGGWHYLSQQIAAQPCHQLRIVFGMVDDKDVDTVMTLLPKQAVYYWTQASSKRAFPATEIAIRGQHHGLQGVVCPNVYKAYCQALADADVADFIFVGGSSYVVADLLSAFREL